MDGEDFEMLYRRTLAERNAMHMQLQDLLDKFKQLQTNSQVSINAVRGKMEENDLKVGTMTLT